VEISNYGMMMNHESDAKVRKVFQDIYVEDVEHARLLGRFVP
jgi:rubrerythrin